MKSDDHVLRQRVRHLRAILPLVLLLVSLLPFTAVIIKGEANGLSRTIEIPMVLQLFLIPFVTYWMLRHMGNWIDEYSQSVTHVNYLERQLAAAAQSSADAIITTDCRGHIETWNQGAELLFGYKGSMVIGCQVSGLFGQGPAGQREVSELIETVQRHGFVRKQELLCVDSSGCLIQVELTATLLDSSFGRDSGMSLILRDITSRKQLEENSKRSHLKTTRQAEDRAHELAEKIAQLAQANEDLLQLDQTRSEFVSLISHQIRAPLTNMAGAAQRMQADCGNANQTCSRMFAVFEEQVSRLDRLVHDVLNVASIDSGVMALQLEPISILPVVRHAIQQFSARLSSSPIRLAEKPGLPLAFADRDRVTEVLSNLIDNAYKYSPAGTEIEIDVRANQNEITVSIRDFGPGLAEKDLERVFDKFYRSDSSDSQSAYGYGLGLYVCRRLIEAHNGSIWAENHPNGGMVISFSLPTWRD